jgi:DNA-binding ferritin-like protein
MAKIRLTESYLKQIILENVKKALNEEEVENEASNGKIVDLISFLHNAQLPVREIHWNTRNNALHLLTDSAIDELLDWEDRLAETYLGSNDRELKINDTKPSSGEFKGIMEELSDLATEVKESFGDSKQDENINAVLDEILEAAKKNIYRSDFK